jgi:hypothetical protein
MTRRSLLLLICLCFPLTAAASAPDAGPGTTAAPNARATSDLRPHSSAQSDPNARMRRLLLQSETLRQLNKEKNKFWFINQPSCLSYDRLSGSVGP